MIRQMSGVKLKDKPLCVQFADNSTYLWQSIIDDAIDEWCKCIQACICAKGRYLEHLMWMFTFLRSEKKSN